jgi:outer membrane protein assembly factor BamB
MAALLLAIATAAGTAEAQVAVSGTVFADLDGDGLFSPGDEPIAGAVVAFESGQFTVTDEAGRYLLAVSPGGIVWVRTPDGFSPAPSWGRVEAGIIAQTIDLPLRPVAAEGPLTFINASDTHLGRAASFEVEQALLLAASFTPTPHFIAVTGDLTNFSSDAEFLELVAAIDEAGVPVVPVVGNHDRGGGGEVYRRHLGPLMYSFDAGGVHFVVLDHAAPADEIEGFLAADAAFRTPGAPVVAFIHVSPLEKRHELVPILEDAGVTHLFTGHWHTNRVIHHDRMSEFNTQPLVMGGIDFSPAGYRAVTMDGGLIAITHHNTTDQAFVEVVWPREGDCVSPGEVEVLAAVNLPARAPRVTAVVEGQPKVSLTYRGGWGYGGKVVVGSEPRQELVVTVTAQGREPLVRRTNLCSASRPVPPEPLAEWPQLGGGPGHEGRFLAPVTPPLEVAWATHVGGHVWSGSPILAGGRLFVAVVDLADATRGGVVALDPLTGALLWEFRTGDAVHGAPAVAGGAVVIATSEGSVHALDVATGGELWSYDLSAGVAPPRVSTLYAGPAISGGVVYVGVQRHVVGLDLATGAVVWRDFPSPTGTWPCPHTSPAAGDGHLVWVFACDFDEVVTWRLSDGARRGSFPNAALRHIGASPIVAGGRAHVDTGGTVFRVFAVVTGAKVWERELVDGGRDWRFGISATPALAGGRLFVPTFGETVLAVDAETGVELWSHGTGPSLLRARPYGTSGGAYTSSPVVTGDIVWIGGTDGVLRALAAADGRELWSTQLGAPIMSGPAPSTDTLFVATWDGSVRALTRRLPGPPAAPPGIDGRGRGCAAGDRRASAPSALLLVLLALVALLRRRR